MASLAVDDVEPPEGARLTLPRVVRDAREALRDEGVRLAPAGEAALDGEPAGRLDGTTRTGSRVRQVVCLRDGTVYTVTLVAAAPAFDARAAALDALLRSWRWD